MIATLLVGATLLLTAPNEAQGALSGGVKPPDAAAKSQPKEAKAPSRLLKPGQCSNDVKRLNRRLVRLRYLRPKEAGRCYGSATMHAVMALQKWEGIGRDGVYGPQTAKTAAKAKRPHASRRYRSKGKRVEIDLSRQLAFLVTKNGRLKQVISISSGAPGYDTPKGTYSVYRKERMSWSVPYQVWMPWASYFVGGIALHESPDVPGYPASHGCVRVPKPFAKRVYRFADYGTPVIVRR